MKTPGTCIVCEEAYIEVTAIHTGDHPLGGQPKAFGKMHDDAVRADLVMIDGSTMTTTVHEKCCYGLEQNIVAHWRSMLERYKFERVNHAAFGHDDFTEVQNDQADKYHAMYIDNPPLGLIMIEKWSDHANRTN